MKRHLGSFHRPDDVIRNRMHILGSIAVAVLAFGAMSTTCRLSKVSWQSLRALLATLIERYKIMADKLRVMAFQMLAKSTKLVLTRALASQTVSNAPASQLEAQWSRPLVYIARILCPVMEKDKDHRPIWVDSRTPSNYYLQSCLSATAYTLLAVSISQRSFHTHHV